MTAIDSGLTLHWEPDFLVDVAAALRPLRRGMGDPTMRDVDGVRWWGSTTPSGAATLALLRLPDRAVRAQAWGPGAQWVLDRVPAVLGAHDDPSSFVSHHDRVSAARRRLPDLRLGSTGRVWDVLFAAVLEQKVTGTEAFRSWRELARRFGEPAPGPAPAGLRVPPTPQAVPSIPEWEWHRAGVDFSRRRALLAAASVAVRLERAAQLQGEQGRALLQRIPGVGVWTSAEVAQRAWGDADAVSFGDFHLSTVVGWALVGRPLDDAGMAQVLAPYAGQRQRAVRLLVASGAPRPRFGPRLSPRNYRSC